MEVGLEEGKGAGPRQAGLTHTHMCTPGPWASSGGWLGVSSIYTGAGSSSSRGLLMGPKDGRAPVARIPDPRAVSEGPSL